MTHKDKEQFKSAAMPSFYYYWAISHSKYFISLLSGFLSSWGWNRVFSLVCYIPQNKAIRSSSDESNFETGEIFIMGCSTRVLVWNILSQSRRCGQPQIDKMHIFIPITESSISPHISKVCLNESEKNKLEINPILHGLLIR